MLRVAILFALVCESDGVHLLGASGVDVAVKSSALRLLLVWLSDGSAILGFRYCNVGGVL